MKVFIIGLFFLIPVLSIAQNSGTIQGKVLDAEIYNEPLLMASVNLKNTEWSTRTNFNGNFEIEGIDPGYYTIQISFLGYQTIEKKIEVHANENIYIQETLTAKSIKSMDLNIGDTAEKDKE